MTVTRTCTASFTLAETVDDYRSHHKKAFFGNYIRSWLLTGLPIVAILLYTLQLYGVVCHL